MNQDTRYQPISRRSFLLRSAAVGLSAYVPSLLRGQASSADPATASFASDWDLAPDRVWIGPEYWANPLQDWELKDGRLVCNRIGRNRNLHLLTRDLGSGDGAFVTSVKLGRFAGGNLASSKGSAGFRIGVTGPLKEFRNNLIFGHGLDAGLAEGKLFIGDPGSGSRLELPTNCRELVLRLSGESRGGACELHLEALEVDGGSIGSCSTRIDSRRLEGNVSLVSNFGPGTPTERFAPDSDEAEGDCFWFADWRLEGSAVAHHSERAFGPVLFSHYTLGSGILKMTAQMPPLGETDNKEVTLELKGKEGWRPAASAKIDPEACTARFRVENWKDGEDRPYRLVYHQTRRDGNSSWHEWSGVVRRDPLDKQELVVGDVSCNFHAAFPNSDLVGNMAKLNPDLLAFVGDQFYESSGGYGVERAPLDRAILDYLRKWYLHGWTWRELMRDRPSLCLPDDHDVYHGNLWGEGGAEAIDSREKGGYGMPAAWVNVVHRTQTAHHPDPHDPEPGVRGVSQWYGAFEYGGLGFAVLADRQYKSGPEGKVPPTGNPRADHVTDPNFDPATADVAGLELLGAEQEAFFDAWSADWSEGVEMKVVVSQTIFSAMATTHGPQRQILRADYDANGWPQTPRQRAVRAMRRASAFHVAGDQHLPALVQYGVDRHGDGPVAFAGPAVNVGYPRWWEPATAPWTKAQGSGLRGDFRDSFDHPLTVLAVANGRAEPRRGDVLRLMEDKASGLGIVRFDKHRMTATVECWPYQADPTVAGSQYPGWPVVIDMIEHHRRGAAAFLPELHIRGVKRPVVEVIDEATQETVYGLRLNRARFAPHVFAPGSYAVRIRDTNTGRERRLSGLEAEAKPSGSIEVSLG